MILRSEKRPVVWNRWRWNAGVGTKLLDRRRREREMPNTYEFSVNPNILFFSSKWTLKTPSMGIVDKIYFPFIVGD